MHEWFHMHASKTSSELLSLEACPLLHGRLQEEEQLLLAHDTIGSTSRVTLSQIQW